MAKLIAEFEHYAGGTEGHMSELAKVLLGFSIIGLIACVIISVSSWGDGFSVLWIAVGVACLIQGIALFIILQAGAELIRLLKKLNGLNYGGSISEPKPVCIYKCTECGVPVQVTNFVRPYRICPKCNSAFDKVDIS